MDLSMHADEVLSIELLCYLLDKEEARAVIKKLDKERREEANNQLLEVLVGSGVASSLALSGEPGTQKSVAPDWMQPADGGIRVILIKKAAYDLALPLVGLALALVHIADAADGAVDSGDAAEATVAAVDTVRAFWHSVVTLRPAEDADAIAVVRCLARLGAREALIGRQRTGADLSSIQADCALTSERTTAALAKLEQMRVVLVEPGDAEDHVANPGAKWRLSL